MVTEEQAQSALTVLKDYIRQRVQCHLPVAEWADWAVKELKEAKGDSKEKCPGCGE